MNLQDSLSSRLGSPLHTAIREQLLGRVSLDRAAPAIFLLTHTAFDPATLRVAADIYAHSEVRGAHVLVWCLLEEAGQREANFQFAAAWGRVPHGRLHMLLRGTESGPLAELLTELSERIGLCAEVTDGVRRSAFNEGVRAAQKEVEALILRLPQNEEVPSNGPLIARVARYLETLGLSEKHAMTAALLISGFRGVESAVVRAAGRVGERRQSLRKVGGLVPKRSEGMRNDGI